MDKNNMNGKVFVLSMDNPRLDILSKEQSY